MYPRTLEYLKYLMNLKFPMYQQYHLNPKFLMCP
jgi:hypothetical protein